MKQTSIIAALMITTLALSGCREEQASAPVPKPAATTPVLPSSLFVVNAPADAKPIAAVRSDAKAGDTVAFTGYIGGRPEPFTEGRAIFLVADPVAAPPCSDGCKTPWDACCTPSEDIIANSATVQVVDVQGVALKIGLDGQGGLKSGARVAIAGKVRESAAGGVFIVDANTITALP